MTDRDDLHTPDHHDAQVRAEVIDWIEARKYPYDVSSIAIEYARDHFAPKPEGNDQ